MNVSYRENFDCIDLILLIYKVIYFASALVRLVYIDIYSESDNPKLVYRVNVDINLVTKRTNNTPVTGTTPAGVTSEE